VAARPALIALEARLGYQIPDGKMTNEQIKALVTATGSSRVSPLKRRGAENVRVR